MITQIWSINTMITWLLWHLISGQFEDPWRQETKNTCISNAGTPKLCGYLIYQQAHMLQQRQGIPLYAFRQHYWTEPSSSTAVVSSPLCTWLASFSWPAQHPEVDHYKKTTVEIKTQSNSPAKWQDLPDHMLTSSTTSQHNHISQHIRCIMGPKQTIPRHKTQVPEMARVNLQLLQGQNYLFSKDTLMWCYFSASILCHPSRQTWKEGQPENYESDRAKKVSRWDPETTGIGISGMFF